MTKIPLGSPPLLIVGVGLGNARSAAAAAKRKEGEAEGLAKEAAEMLTKKAVGRYSAANFLIDRAARFLIDYNTRRNNQPNIYENDSSRNPSS
jgi:hypothetical protein